MRVLITGSKNLTDLNMLKIAIIESKFEITELVTDMEEGIGELAEKWAIMSGIPIKKFPIEWNNLKVEGAEIKINKWRKPYNSKAAACRDDEMVGYIEGAITIFTDGDKDYIVKKIKDSEKPLYQHKAEILNKKYRYQF